MNNTYRVVAIDSSGLSRGLGRVDDAIDEFGVVDILVDDFNAWSQVEDVVQLVGGDVVGSRTQMFDPLHHFVGDLVDLQAKVAVGSRVANMRGGKNRFLCIG